MVTIEQIRLLEKKVHGAVEHIDLLTRENRSLKSRLEDYETRVSELEKLIDSFKQDQSEIEQGIITALNELNRLEDDLDTTDDTTDDTAGDSVPPMQTDGEAARDTETDSSDVTNSEKEPTGDSSSEDSEDAEDSQTGELDIF